MNGSVQETCWSKDNLQNLFSAMKSSIPKQQRGFVYNKGVKMLNWTNVAFPPFSAEDCQKKWAEVMDKMRKIRSLTELLVEAEEVISNPSLNKKLLPGYPKRPPPPSILYSQKKYSKLLGKHPEMKSMMLINYAHKKYQTLSKEMKAKYEKQYNKEKKEYQRKMQQFREQYHIKSRRSYKAIVDSDDDIYDSHDLQELPPPPPSTSYIAFCKEQRLNTVAGDSSEKQDLTKELLKRWNGLSASEKLVYKERCKELKREYEKKLETFLNRFNHEERKQILDRKQIKVSKKLLGIQTEPKKPPMFGNLCFVQAQMGHLKSTIPNTKDRFIKVNQMWRELPEDTKNDYNQEAKKGIRIYSAELLAWFKKLPRDEQEAFRKKNPAKMKYIEVNLPEVYEPKEVLHLPSLDADDAKVTFEEEPGQDVYCETQMPL